jgi:hypothetical protein
MLIKAKNEGMDVDLTTLEIMVKSIASEIENSGPKK